MSVPHKSKEIFRHHSTVSFTPLCHFHHWLCHCICLRFTGTFSLCGFVAGRLCWFRAVLRRFAKFDFFFFEFQYYLAGFLFPICGFTIASLVAFVCRQDLCDRFAIAAETINFNVFIALSISTSMLPGNTSKELATLLANLVVIMTPIPLFLQFLWYRARFVHTPHFVIDHNLNFLIKFPFFACVFTENKKIKSTFVKDGRLCKLASKGMKIYFN